MKRWLGTAVLLLAVAVVAYWQRAELAGALHALGQAHPLPVLGALLCQFAFFLAMVLLHARAFTAVGVPASLRDMAPVWFRSLFVNLAAPGTGPAAFLADGHQRGIPPARTASALLLVRVCDFVTFALVLVGGLVILAQRGALHPAEGLAAFGLLLVIVFWSAGLVLARFAPNTLRRILNKVEQWSRHPRLGTGLPEGWATEQVNHAAESAELLSDPARWKGPLVAALLAHIADFATVWFLMLGFGVAGGAGTALAAYSIGLLFWIVSVTPDGLGAVEGMMAFAFHSLGVPLVSAAAVTLSFRVLTLWLPVAVGGVLELVRLRPLRGVPPGEIGVRSLALLTGAMGVVNVISAVQPALAHRFALLERFLPLTALYGSNLAAGVAGFALILVARGLFRRKRLAYRLTVGALGLSVLAHLAKGLDWEEATLALFLLTALWRLRHWFVARSDGPTVQNGLRVLAMTCAFTLVYGVTGFWLLDRQFSRDFGFWDAIRQTLAMFFEFGASGLEPITPFGAWFADSVYLVAASTFTFSLFALLSHVLLRQRATDTERERAKAIVEAHGRSSLARFLLFPDKLYWFSPGGSVVGYALVGRNAVALGDPIGPAADIAEAITGFARFCRENDWVTAFYQTLPDHLVAYEEAGFRTLCVGSEAVVDMEGFTLSGRTMKSLRGHVGRLTKAGYTTEVLTAPHPPELLRHLRTISDEWLHGQHSGEKRFSLGWFDDTYLNDGPIIIARNADSEVVAFANIIPEYQRNETTVDLMRQSRTAEPGVMDLLFVALFDWAKSEGFDTFNLGLAPLSGVGQNADDPLVERVLNLVYRRANRFYSYEGLYTYKRKFQPEWEPRYLVYAGTARLAQSFSAVVRANNPHLEAAPLLRRVVVARQEAT